ncbi:cell wall-active antibiotics response protein LiaF [Bacillus sp. FJAT-47783]|uniref:cell wall-active antibiotics response protein LiaF n=1 Tax=Bacillus sp. FJAT-47783 TaxID=2922712 RepID=UPI001FABC060|nr:cell wall-active antibiotics response protein LiaF [Bacillus sp. FJAT-47783]
MKSKRDYWSWVFYIAVGLLLFEIIFLNGDTLYSLFFSFLFIYFGKKYYHRLIGKIVFWLGIVSASISLFQSLAVRWFLFAIIIYIFIQYVKQKKRESVVIIDEVREKEATNEEIICRKPFFQNKFIGRQRTKEAIQEWEDVNVQGFVGDLVIDLSHTVFANGEAIIFVRHVLGNVQVLVPYDLDVSVHVSLLAGTVDIFDCVNERVFSESVLYQTKDYQAAQQKVKILTSMIAGHIEVKRI